MKLVEPILTFDISGKELFTKNKKLISTGDSFKNPAFANFLKLVVNFGSDYFYNGRGLDYIINHCENNSHLSRKDFNSYIAYNRNPVKIDYNGYQILTNPSPSFGGSLIIFLLKLLSDSKKSINNLNLIKAMNLTSKVRNEVCKNPNDEYEINKIFNEDIYNKYLKLFNCDTLDFAKDTDGFGSTTHISILDKEGNAASITTTNGEGCGYVMPEYGIMMNNMLGEQDLNPFGFHIWDNPRRLPTMISPTIILKNNKPIYILGSGGSNRIRSANIQVILNLIHNNMSLEEAINAPRIHLEENNLFCEPGVNLNGRHKLNGLLINLFDEKNVFFGGVNAVSQNESVGDIRRGGHGIIY